MARKRRSPATADDAPPPPAGPKHNVPPKVVQSYAEELAGTRRAIAEAQGRHRAATRRAKKDGINVAAMAEVLGNRPKDSAEVARHYDDVNYYASCTGQAYATQTDFFRDGAADVMASLSEADRSGAAELNASEAGYTAGKQGVKAASCPYPVGSPLAQVWTKHWHDGQAALAMELGPDETATVAKPRRGRPRANGSPAAQLV